MTCLRLRRLLKGQYNSAATSFSAKAALCRSYQMRACGHLKCHMFFAVNMCVQIDGFDTTSSENPTMKAVKQHKERRKMKAKGGKRAPGGK